MCCERERGRMMDKTPERIMQFPHDYPEERIITWKDDENGKFVGMCKYIRADISDHKLVMGAAMCEALHDLLSSLAQYRKRSRRIPFDVAVNADKAELKARNAIDMWSIQNDTST